MSTPEAGPPPIPPVPAYGEYAQPAPSPEQAPAYPPQYSAPQYSPPQSSAPQYSPPPYSPQPYGQQPYAPQPYGQQPYAPQPYGQQPYPAQYGAPHYGSAGYEGVRPIRTADAIISIVLMVIGLAGVVMACFTAAEGLGSFMQGGYDSAGLGTYVPTGAQGVTQAVLVGSHLVLYLVSVPLTIMLIVKRRISFWLPLTAGTVAAIVFWVTLLTFMYADPVMYESIMAPSQY